MNKSLKVVCISDTNGAHEGLQHLEGDILIHCGDFTRSGTQNEFYQFINFLAKLNFKYKVLIAGHKEMTFDIEMYESKLKSIFHKGFPDFNGQVFKAQLLSLDGVYYLEHEYLEIEGIKIFGSPFQPVYFDCGFGREPEHLQAKWKPIDQKIDILVTHYPPLGVMDKYKGSSTGCKYIKQKVDQLKPTYHIFGHNREQYGLVKINQTTFVSCCRFDAKFKPANPPICFQIQSKALDE